MQVAHKHLSSFGFTNSGKSWGWGEIKLELGLELGVGIGISVGEERGCN